MVLLSLKADLRRMSTSTDDIIVKAFSDLSDQYSLKFKSLKKLTAI
jgi:hypothetical protein